MFLGKEKMANLLEEYRKRHGIEAICPANEGVLFFEYEGKAPLIVLMSTRNKALGSCVFCSRDQRLVFELCCPAGNPELVRIVSHEHIAPDEDIMRYIPKGYKPYVSKGERDQERWLWEKFFLCVLSEKSRKSFRGQDWISGAVELISASPDSFDLFYENIYAPILINRRYILT